MRKTLILTILALLIIQPLFALAQGVDYRFTGQELDAESGLYNFNAREYNPNIGRFNQPDPLLNDLNQQMDFLEMSKNPKINQNLEHVLMNPQQLNYYSYALNNPLIYTDPSGKLQIHFNKDMSEQQKQQFMEGLKYLQEHVQDNQQIQDYFKKFDVDIVSVLKDNSKGPDVYFKKEIKTKDGGSALGQYDSLWNNIEISFKTIATGIEAVGSTLIHELGHYAEDVGSIFGRLRPNFDGELGLKQNYVTLWMKYNLGMDNKYLEKIEREFGYLAEYLTFGFIF